MAKKRKITHIRPPNPVAKAMLSNPRTKLRLMPTKKTQRMNIESRRISARDIMHNHVH